jgi:hypothetical protein
MGDYTKVIVNCSVKKKTEAELVKYKKEWLDNVYLCTSAYHCGGELLEFSNEWNYRTDVTFVTQLKYSQGLKEFIAWLKPQVIDGCGERGCFAMSFTEYQKEPTMYYKNSYHGDSNWE